LTASLVLTGTATLLIRLPPALIPLVNVWLATKVLATVVYATLLGSTPAEIVPGPVMLLALRFVSAAPLPVKLDAVTPPPTVSVFVIVSLLTPSALFTVTDELKVVVLLNDCGAVNVLLEFPTCTDSAATTELVAW
jgi:hypothetical protein